MHVEFTLPLWPFAVWLLIGLMLIVPANLYAGTQVSPRRGWKRSLWNRAHPFSSASAYVVGIVAWPLVLWELYRVS